MQAPERPECDCQFVEVEFLDPVALGQGALPGPREQLAKFAAEERGAAFGVAGHKGEGRVVGGYAARTVLLSAPGQMNIALSPGGSIEIASTSATPREARLIDDAGRVYYLFGRMRSFTIDGAVATLRSVAPGNYTLQLFDSSGAVTGTKQLSVLEGQVARISM